MSHRSDWAYLPILKWKQGERRALQELTPDQWKSVVPFIELLAIPTTPGFASLNSALPGYLDKVLKYLKKTIPETKPIVIDTRWVAPSYTKQARLLTNVCKKLANAGELRIIPAVSEALVAKEPSELRVVAEFEEAVLRIRTSNLQASQVRALVDFAVKQGLSRKRLHLVMDQHSIVDEEPKMRFSAIRPYLDQALACRCASVTVAGGSFPVNLIGFRQGVYDLPRVEWSIWQRLRARNTYKPIRFSDYAVTNPGPLADLDPTQMNPSVAIRYAAEAFWRLFKAGGFKRGKPNQYRGLCALLLSDETYAGAAFSYGDACYEEAAEGRLGNGNPSSWRRDATSHHLVLTASQLQQPTDR